MVLEVVLSGCGPCGAYLALLLQTQHNCRVRVFEKRPDLRTGKADHGRSINLILTSRGLHALAQVGLLQAALNITVPVQERAVHLADGTVTHQPYGISKSEVNHSVSRTQINAMLIQAAEDAGVKFFFEHTVERVDLLPEDVNSPFAGRILVHDAGHSKRTFWVDDASMIIGTDGAGSSVRTGVYNAQVFAGERNAKLYMERLGISYKEVQFHSTKEGHYPLKPSGLHIWPRGAQFLMALADLEPSLTGTMYVPDGSAPVPDSGLAAGKLPENLAEKFDEDPIAFQAYVKRLYPDLPSIVPDYMTQLRKVPFTLLATLRSSHWHYSSRGICLGDAAHAVVPFFGQGMNLGLESAWTLSLFLGDTMKTWSKEVRSKTFRLAVSRRMQDFVTFHQPNAKAIADMAIANYAEMASHVSKPWFQKRKAIESHIEKTFGYKLRSRYYMVTNTLIPYALVEEAGKYISRCVDDVQKHMDEKGYKSPSEVDSSVIEAAIDRHVTPFYNKHGIQVNQPKLEYYTKNARRGIRSGMSSKL